VALRAARTFAAAPEGIAAADAFLRDIGNDNDIPERAIFRARVCVAELAANILEHGQAPSDRNTFTVAVAWGWGATLDLEFADTSRPFDPTRPEAVPHDPDCELANGRGLRLVQTLPARSRYSHDGKLNRTRLEFTLD
jgi:anti-sigma regulatory factor (Ser/Thr protein kinase)